MNRVLVLFLVATAVVYIAAAAASWVARKRAPRAVTTAPPSNAAVGRAMLTAQLPGVASAIFSVVLFIALLRPSVAVTGRVGLPLALSAGACVTAGLLMFSALPPARPYATGPASAEAVPLKARSLRGRWTIILPATVLTAFLALVLATGITSATDSQGRYRILAVAGSTPTAAAIAYPGWTYGVPLMLVAIVLAGAMALALRRIAASPSLPDPRMAALDRKWRKISTRIVARLGTGTLLAYLGGTALMAGLAMAGVGASAGGGANGPQQPLLALGITSAAVGAALGLAGVVVLVLAARDALTIRAASRRSDS